MKAIVQVNTIKLSFRNALMTLDFIIPSKKKHYWMREGKLVEF